MTGAEMMALNDQGATYLQIAKLTGKTRSAVSGAIFRARNPTYNARLETRGFRDIEHVKTCVALADLYGPCAAARMLKMHNSQLCEWRKRLRTMEAA